MAILFDGSANGDHYSMSGASHPQPNDFTFKIRARFRSWTVGISGLGGILFSSWLESTGGNDAVLITNSAAGVITVRSISGGSIVASATTSALSLNTNYEFLLSYTSNTTNGIKLYINGVLAAQCNSPAAIAYDDTYFGGGDSQASDAYWNCWTYWSGAHSAAEALAEVNQDTPQKSSGLWDTWNPTSYQAVTYTGNINSKPFTNQSAGDTYVVDDLPISFPTRAIAVSLAIERGQQHSQSSGGWAFWMSYEKRKREELEEETEAIEESVDRDIARFLREQEAQDARRAELDRLGNIARRHADAAEARAYSERVAVALERAIEKGTFSALEALDREIERAQTEEELVLSVQVVSVHRAGLMTDNAENQRKAQEALSGKKDFARQLRAALATHAGGQRQRSLFQGVIDGRDGSRAGSHRRPSAVGGSGAHQPHRWEGGAGGRRERSRRNELRRRAFEIAARSGRGCRHN
jgi:hypothetical protein